MKLKIKLLPYENLKKYEFNSLFKDLKDDTIILVDAKLKSEEEAQLIKETMKKVSEKFSGIELSSLELSSENNINLFGKLKKSFVEMLIGKKRGLTLIGPAKIIRKIRKNPEHLMLYT
ncbi:MAG: DUF2073 domain-containing protein [Nanoarchaeota archaeon]|nr:DUF2073 domain-containing protein [Nanoarchaeota archaeon]MBU1135558.1 DUF2073 domain-containing protein [Nanoarchaeota archaeon]MBU2520377.1 DUF2073 domain-containing protein [Nanoarchaeota archaeon]